MNRFISYGVTAVAFVILCSCDSKSGNNNTPSNSTKYLARNIILNTNLVNKANAQAPTIDTTTQIPANNVVFEATSDSQITSNNVQSALEEITLKLNKTIIGTWNIQNYNHEVHYSDKGKIIFNPDGSFDLIDGSFAAIGMGSGINPDSFCKHAEANQTYQFFTDEVVLFIHFNDIIDPPARNAVIPQLVKLRKDEIIFIGSGGCGSLGQQRISILTRVP